MRSPRILLGAAAQVSTRPTLSPAGCSAARMPAVGQGTAWMHAQGCRPKARAPQAGVRVEKRIMNMR